MANNQPAKVKTPDDDLEGYWSKRQIRFAGLINSGLTPIEAIRQMDKEDGRSRTQRAQDKELAQLKPAVKQLTHFGDNPEDMADEKWEKYHDFILQSILTAPKEYSPTALQALDRLADRRKFRKFGTHEAVMETLQVTMDELLRLCDPKIWANRSGESFVCHGAESGSEDAPNPEEEQRRNALKTAIRGTLKTFRDQQKQILDATEKTLEELNADFDPVESTVLVS